MKTVCSAFSSNNNFKTAWSGWNNNRRHKHEIDWHQQQELKPAQPAALNGLGIGRSVCASRPERKLFNPSDDEMPVIWRKEFQQPSPVYKHRKALRFEATFLLLVADMD